MTSIFARTTISAVSKLGHFVHKSPTVQIAKCIVGSSCNSNVWNRGFARGYWLMSRRSQPRKDVVISSKKPGRPCGCCGIHTEGDQDMSKFLKNEIQVEKQSPSYSNKLPDIQGFDVSTTDSSVVLTKKLDNETIRVLFNINNTVDADDSLDPKMNEGEEEAPASMVSRPQFQVEISKGEGQILAFQCAIPPADDLMENEPANAEEEALMDQFDLEEVALHNGDWSETIYSVSSSIMDGNLYDHFMDMLDDRGINDDFIKELVEFSTAFDHTHYVKFLEGLKSFVDKN